MSRWTRSATAVVLALAGAGATPASPIEAEAMLKAADAPHNAFSEGTIRLRVVANDHGKKAVASVLELFVKGSDKVLCVFREGKQKGRKILTVGDRVWLIVPGTSRPVPVSKSQRLTGAASFGDVARVRFADEYVATLRPDEEALAGEGDTTRCRVLDLAARRKGSAYPTAILWVGVDDGLARRLRLSLASGKEAKDVRYASYDAKHRIKRMEIRDLLSAGGANVTRLDFDAYEQRPLDPALFDPEGARAAP